MHVLDWPNPFYLDAVEFMDLSRESDERMAESLKAEDR